MALKMIQQLLLLQLSHSFASSSHCGVLKWLFAYPLISTSVKGIFLDSESTNVATLLLF